MLTGVFSRPHSDPSLMAAAVKYRQYWRHDYTLLHLVRLQHTAWDYSLAITSHLTCQPCHYCQSRLVQTPQSADNAPRIVVIVAAGSRQLHIISHIMAMDDVHIPHVTAHNISIYLHFTSTHPAILHLLENATGHMA